MKNNQLDKVNPGVPVVDDIGRLQVCTMVPHVTFIPLG